MKRLEILINQINPKRILSSGVSVVKKKEINLKQILQKIIQTKKLPVFLEYYVQMFLLKRSHFNMIEILIAVSIIVTFSGLTGVVMARKYEESKESYAKLDLIKIQEGLIIYFTKNSQYPLDLEQLVFKW
jgi:hypothetical protein